MTFAECQRADYGAIRRTSRLERDDECRVPSGSVDNCTELCARPWHSPHVMARMVLSLYSLDPAMPVLLRPDGNVQVGWDPRRAVLVRPPAGLSATGLAALLRSMRFTGSAR